MIKSRFRLTFMDLVRPGGFDTTRSEALVVLSWLGRIAPYNSPESMWLGLRDPYRPLGTDSSLDMVFQRLLLGNNPEFGGWKRRHGIDLLGERWICGRHSKYVTRLNWLMDFAKRPDRGVILGFNDRGHSLKTSLNTCHPQARGLGGVEFRFCFDGRIGVFLRYTLEGSAWNHTLTVERTGEAVDDWAARAWRALAMLVSDAAAPIVVETYSAPAYAVCRLREGWPLESNAGLPGGHRWPGYEVLGLFDTRAEAEDAAYGK